MRVQVEEPRITATGLLWSGSIGAVSALNQLIMILFLTYFILLSDKMFRRKFVELAGPTLSKKKITVEIIDDISSQIGRFLMVQIFTSVVVGVATWAALPGIGLEQAALWGLLAGIFNSIPVLRPAHRQRRPLARGVPSVRHALHDAGRRRRLARHHLARRLAADADCSWAKSRR